MTDNTKPIETIREAVAYFDRQWPEQLISGVMFFKGLRITKAEFSALATQEKSNVG